MASATVSSVSQASQKAAVDLLTASGSSDAKVSGAVSVAQDSLSLIALVTREIKSEIERLRLPPLDGSRHTIPSLARIIEAEGTIDLDLARDNLRTAQAEVQSSTYEDSFLACQDFLTLAKSAKTFNPKAAQELLRQAKESLPHSQAMPHKKIELLLEIGELAAGLDQELVGAVLAEALTLANATQDQFKLLRDILKAASKIDREFALTLLEVIKTKLDANVHVLLLLDIASIATPLHRELAISILTLVRQKASAILEQHQRALVLLEYAEVAASLDPGSASQAFDEARKIVQPSCYLFGRIKRICGRATDEPSALPSCIEVARLINKELAQNVALTIDDPVSRVHAYLQIAANEDNPELVKANLQYAELALAHVKNFLDRMELSIKIAAIKQRIHFDSNFASLVEIKTSLTDFLPGTTEEKKKRLQLILELAKVSSGLNQEWALLLVKQARTLAEDSKENSDVVSVAVLFDMNLAKEIAHSMPDGFEKDYAYRAILNRWMQIMADLKK